MELKNADKIFNKSIERGDIYYVKAVPAVGNETTGDRPAVVVGNNIGNEKSPVLQMVYLTTQKKNPLPTHVFVRGKNNFISTALCEAVVPVDKSRLRE